MVLLSTWLSTLPCRPLWCLLGLIVYIRTHSYGFLDVFVLPALHLIGDMARAFG